MAQDNFEPTATRDFCELSNWGRKRPDDCGLVKPPHERSAPHRPATALRQFCHNGLRCAR